MFYPKPPWNTSSNPLSSISFATLNSFNFFKGINIKKAQNPVHVAITNAPTKHPTKTFVPP